jgi:RNA polymerase sigma factor (sigma-70 family)
MTNAHVEDKQLLIKVAEGDRKAFTTLYHLHMNSLYRYVYLTCKCSETSREIVQDSFVKVWENRAMLPHVNTFGPYLFTSARNLLLNHIQRGKVYDKIITLITPQHEEDVERSDDGIIFQQSHQLITGAINLLPKKRKMIVELRLQEYLSLDEIANKLCISKSVVKKQLYAGINQIRKHLALNDVITVAFLISFL